MNEKELFELAKKFGDNYTYGQITKVLKEKLNEAKEEVFDDIRDISINENNGTYYIAIHKENFDLLKKKHLNIDENNNIDWRKKRKRREGFPWPF